MFPVMLSLKDRSCLVVGGGGVALRKAASLVEEGARVIVVAPEIVPELEQLAREGRLSVERRAYRPEEAAGYQLVFAATDRREVNRRVFDDAEAAGVWANVADDPELCSFHLPARVQRPPIQLAVASGGEAPFVVRRLRRLLERRFGPEWGEWAEAAARFRGEVRRLGLGGADEQTCFDHFFRETVDEETLTARVPSGEEQHHWLGARGADPIETTPTTGDTMGRDASRSRAAGLVSLVGAGPGCAGLLTVRGRQRLLAADAVVYDRLAAAALPPELPSRVELHGVGKEAGRHPVPQDEITALLLRLAREGKRVVRLKGGDPYVFGRGGEEAELLSAEGIPFEVVPGVTSGIAAPAWMGVPVTHRREAVRVTLLTAHECAKDSGPQVRWDLLAQDPHATLVGYMGVAALPGVVERLRAGGMDPEMPAAMVECGTLASQRRVVSTLAGLPGAVERAGIRPPALFVIGPTVRHADRLDWACRKPLAGERLVVPAAAPALAEELELAGAETVAVPLAVTPAARIVMGVQPLTGCLFRSPAEVDALDDERGGSGFEGRVVAWCLGEATANRARERGWQWVETIGEGVDVATLVGTIADRGARAA